MTNLLILLTLPEAIRNQYYEHLKESFPEVKVDMVDHHSKVGPYIGTADILVGFAGMVRDHVLEEGVNLKWIQGLGTGMDGVIDSPALRDDIVVTNLRGVHGPPMSEAALMAMLALSRNLPAVIRNQDRHVWHRYLPTLLHEKTVGIFGVGVIAEELAPKCRAFGMKVVGISSTGREVPGFDHIYLRSELHEVVPTLDYLVLLTPYSKETHHVIGEKVLSLMKPTAYLVNVSRGGIVDEEALLQAMKRNQIAGAAFDAFAAEPLPDDNPLWDQPNIMITPKLGGFCDVYPKWALPVVDENLRRFLAGETENMINLVKRQGFTS